MGRTHSHRKLPYTSTLEATLDVTAKSSDGQERNSEATQSFAFYRAEQGGRTQECAAKEYSAGSAVAIRVPTLVSFPAPS